MKILGISIVVVLGLVVGLWWTRDGSPVRTGPASPAEQPARRPPVASHTPTRPELAMHAKQDRATKERRTLEPTDANPDRRKAQAALLQELRNFASEAKLTDEQWDRFVRDLSELGEIDSLAWANAVKANDFDGAIEISEDLGDDLEARCAAYMTKEQLSVLRFRLNANGVITRVRQLHFLPSQDHG